MSYTNTIAVHPRDRDFVVCGGFELTLTEDGGKTWRRATKFDEDRGKKPGPRYVHEDHHALAILPNGWIVDGNDGGMAVSEDRGKTWEMRVQGMNTTQFYQVDVAPSNSDFLGGGAQDSGTLLRAGSDVAGHFRRAEFGDGSFVLYDHMDEENIFVSSSNFQIFRHLRKGGGGWLKGGGGQWEQVLSARHSAR
jgi:hypothetical protein